MSRETVQTLLARANITLSEEDLERLLRIHAIVERQVSDLHIPEARHADPATIYSASLADTIS
jgi:hypothetical protein